MKHALAVSALSVALLAAAARQAGAQEPSPPPGPAAGSTAPAAAPVLAPFEGAAPYAKFVDGATSQKGLFTVWRKQGKVYFELAPSQLDRTYLLVPISASGLGQGLFSGVEFDSTLIEFHRAGDRILTVEKNPYGKAKSGSASAEAVATSFPQSVISADPLAAVDKASGNVVFPADVLLTDIVDLTDLFNPQLPPELRALTRATYRLDPRLNYFGPTKAFPTNVDVEADLTWSSPSPGPFFDTVPDARSLFVRMHYTIVELPDDGYRPRLADDRVGFFLTARRQYDDQTTPTSFVRYLNRWRMEKTDPNARVSPAKQPIVYYLSNTIPFEYRKPITDGLLTWNKAFEAVGISHAIEVRPQPDDPNWDPDDARYTVVRWVVSPTATFAYGPSFTNPLTGEIFRADIVIDGNIVRAGALELEHIVDPTVSLSPEQRVACTVHECDYGYGMLQQAQWGALALSLDGGFERLGLTQKQYVDLFLKSIVLHESGHNLGLRHNFQAHTIYSMKQLQDKKFTKEHGIVGSVMEYTPLNLSPHGEPQGELFQTVLGPRDYFSIKYGYQPLPATSPEGELPALAAIAAQATRPGLAYATDEDAAWGTGFATDPRVATFNLSNDPLAYAENVMKINRRLVDTLNARIPKPGRSYAEERRAFEIILSEGWTQVVVTAPHYIGGEYFTRNHRGDPGAKPPFVPVPRAEEKRAFSLLARYVFADDAFQFSPLLLNNLGADRFAHWESSPNASGRLDYPLEQRAEMLQDVALRLMWQPNVLARLNSLESRAARPGETMSLADLYDWTDDAVWGDLARPDLRSVPAIHRALQHRYASMLVHIMLKPDAGTPQDARSLARHHLSWLSGRLASALNRRGLDEPTQANFEDVKTMVDRALSAKATVPAT